MLFLNMDLVCSNDPFREVFKRLVLNKQIEFVGGGWVQNDEVKRLLRYFVLTLSQAVSWYVDVIDQVTLGHEWLAHTFGEHPKVKYGWQIDMFTGYSVRV